MGRGEVYTGFLWRNLTERVDGRIILRWIFRKWDGGMDWIDVAQDGGRWRIPVDAVMNLRVPSNEENF
jgi:hypothetical protein